MFAIGMDGIVRSVEYFRHVLTTTVDIPEPD